MDKKMKLISTILVWMLLLEIAGSAWSTDWPQYRGAARDDLRCSRTHLYNGCPGIR